MSRARFAALLAAFSAACVLLFTMFYRDAKRAAVARLAEEQRTHARQAASGIEDFFATWTSILDAFSRMEEIVQLDATGQRDLKLFFEAHQEQIRSITRMDERGVIVGSVPFGSAVGSDISGQKHVRELLRERRPVVSDVFRAVQGFDAVALHVPVFEGATFRGSIAVVVNFASIARRYLDVVRVGRTGQAWVVSRDATLLYSPLPGLTGKPARESLAGSDSAAAVLEQMLQGREGNAAFLAGAPGGGGASRKYAVYLPIRLGGTFWSIAVASDETELLAGLNSFRNRLAAVVGLVYAGGMLFATLAARAWLIVQEEDKRKRAEQTLRDSEEKFMKAFHATPDAIVISRVADGQLLEVNEVFLDRTGYTRAEAREGGALALGLWADPADRKRYLETVRASGRVRDLEACFRTKGGALLDGLVSGEGIVVGGEPCLLTVIRDVTERKRIEGELERHRLHLEELVAARTAELARSERALKESLEDVHRANRELEAANARLLEVDRLKSLFIASMSHELRTPLNSIIGFTGLLLQGLAGPLNPEQRTQLGMVRDSSRHLLALITDIIDLSKIEAGKLTPAREAVDLVGVARDVLASLGPAAERGGLTLMLDAPAELMVVSDGRRVRQVLVNLVGNAVKFTERGTVTVALRAEAGGARAAVRDTGPGIRADDMGRLFQFFSQAGPAGHSRPEGTGLGLYLSRRLVTLLGGEIGAHSEFGRGSEFWFTLPAELPREAA